MEATLLPKETFCKESFVHHDNDDYLGWESSGSVCQAFKVVYNNDIENDLQLKTHFLYIEIHVTRQQTSFFGRKSKKRMKSTRNKKDTINDDGLIGNIWLK